MTFKEHLKLKADTFCMNKTVEALRKKNFISNEALNELKITLSECAGNGNYACSVDAEDFIVLQT